MSIANQIDPEIWCHPAYLPPGALPYTGREVINNEWKILAYRYWIGGSCTTQKIYEEHLKIRQALHHPSGVTLTF